MFNSLTADAIIPDDQKFIKFLESEQLPIIVPASLIHKICQFKKISKEQALSSLQKIKPLIKDGAFEKIDIIAYRQSDNEFAEVMRKEERKLFELIMKTDHKKGLSRRF